MKKLIILVPLTLILIGALVFSGCAKEAAPAAATTPAAPAPAPAPAAPAPAPAAPAPAPAAPAAKTAAFTLSNLSISPTEVDIMKDVTISVTVSNTGEVEGSYDVVVKINNAALPSQTVKLAGGAKQTVTFTATRSSAGTYTVKADSLSGTFTVKAPPPPPPKPTATGTAPAGGATVYVSVSVDGKLLVAAQPVTYTEGMTLEDVIKAAHEAYYSGGDSGYDISTNNAFSMYMVNKCWGVAQIPFIILNDHPNSEKTFEAVNTVKVAANDNVILCTSNTQGAATPVSLKATVSGDSATVTATAWTLNMSTFAYTSAPLANAKVVDPTTGTSLGTTDAKGSITVKVPESGVVAIEGLAAIRVKAATK